MKLVLAVIRPNRLDAVKEILREIGVDGITSVEASDSGGQGGRTEMYRGATYHVDFEPKVQVEVVVDDGEVESVVDAITRAARTGKAGDGMIVVLPVEGVHGIGPGESGPHTL